MFLKLNCSIFKKRKIRINVYIWGTKEKNLAETILKYFVPVKNKFETKSSLLTITFYDLCEAFVLKK